MPGNRLIPPRPGAERRWIKTAGQYLMAGWPTVLVLLAAFYGGASALYRLGDLLGGAGVVVAEAVTIFAAGPLFHWFAAGIAERLHAGDRGLVMPAGLPPAHLLALGGWLQLVVPACWAVLWGALVAAYGPEVVEPLANRPWMALGVGIVMAGAFPTHQNFRLARAVYLGADGGHLPADFSLQDQLILIQLAHRVSTLVMIPMFIAYVPAMLVFPPLAVVTLAVAFWATALSYIVLVDLYGGDPAPQTARQTTPAAQPAGAGSS